MVFGIFSTAAERRQELVRYFQSTTGERRQEFVRFFQSTETERRQEFVRLLQSEKTLDVVRSHFISFLESERREEFVRFLQSEKSLDALRNQFISFLRCDEGKRLLVELLIEALAGRELAPILEDAEKRLKDLAAEQVGSFRTTAQMDLDKSAASYADKLQRKVREGLQQVASSRKNAEMELEKSASSHAVELKRKAREAGMELEKSAASYADELQGKAREALQDVADRLYWEVEHRLSSYKLEIAAEVEKQLRPLLRQEIARHNRENSLNYDEETVVEDRGCDGSVGSFRERGIMERHKEHYEIASRFGGREFTLDEFMRLYEQVYPNRPRGSMLPSDYCVNPSGGRHAIGTEDYPKFLRWLGRGKYQMDKHANPP